MKDRVLKRIFAALALSVAAIFTATFSGCARTPENGRDGADGKDFNIYEIYEAVKRESGDDGLTFSDFLKEYLNFTPSDIEKETSFQAAVNRALLSTVAVRAYVLENDSGGLSSRLYNGSGVIVRVDREKGDMYVVTNCHVVYSGKGVFGENDGYSDEISLWLYGSEFLDGCKIKAEIVAASKTYDVALLKVEDSAAVKRSHAVAAEWAAGEESFIGEKVFAAGNANGNKISANAGYITKDLEEVLVDLGDTDFNGLPAPYEYNVIRTSAEINGGNSGGGLFDKDGRLVGLVNAKGREDALGEGYALTAATVRRVVARMIDDAADGEKHGVNVVKHGVTTAVKDSYNTGADADGLVSIREEVAIEGAYGSKLFGYVNRGDVLRHVKIMRGESAVEDLDILREHNFYDALISVRAGDTLTLTVSRFNGTDGRWEDKQLDFTFDDNDFETV